MTQNNGKLRFRLQSTQFLLTYPHCNIKKEDALKFISEIVPIHKYVICEEKHENGEPHIHAYIKTTKTIDAKSEKYFDINGFHGQYEKCRNFHAVRNYCKQDGNYITNIDTFSPIPAAIRVINAESKEIAMDIIKKDPSLARDYIRDTARIESSVARLFPTINAANAIYRFKTVRSVATWKRNKIALWMKGKTNTGKTEFAKNLFASPLLVSHIDQLKGLSDKHDGIIFDDMNFSKWDYEKQIHILDVRNDRGIDVKFGHIVIKAGTPRIFTSNIPIFSNEPAIKRRIRYIDIKEDLRLLADEYSSDSSANSLEPPIDAFDNMLI